MTRKLSFVVAATLAWGCNDMDAHIPAAGPPPIAGGTLLVTRDGRFAIASDPDRAAIHVVDLRSNAAIHRVQLGPDDEPGRAIEDNDGRVHVVLRRANELLTLDYQQGTIEGRRPLCAAPRGIDVDREGNLVIACADGELVHMTPSTGASRRVTLQDEHGVVSDLRDVVALPDGRLLISRFRNAEVLAVQDDEIIGRVRPPGTDATTTGIGREPTVAWRMVHHPRGALLVHQESQSTQLGTLGIPSGVYYGGDCDTGVIRSVLSLISSYDLTVQSVPLTTTSLAVDVAYDQTAQMTYVAAAAEPGSLSRRSGISRTGLRAVPDSDFASYGSGGCFSSTAGDPFHDDRAAIGVGVLPGGGIVVQYRDPATIVLGEPARPADHCDPYSFSPCGPAADRLATIALDAGHVVNLGHDLFHEAAGTGATCASCHPEGGDDGHVWRFDIGARRTQTLTGGILATAPFHWGGDVPNVAAVMQGTFVGRMGGEMPRADEIEDFGQWMNEVPALPPPPAISPSAVDRGRALFAQSGCDSCHSGDHRTDNETIDSPTGHFQVPALYEVAYHAPYLHDGRSPTLEDAIAHHQSGAAMTDAQKSDLAAYLRSL